MSIDQTPFDGVGVALVTLFDDSEQLLVEATAAHAARVVDQGARAVLVAGSTGEAWHLTADDRRRLTVAVRDALPAEVPVLVGTGHPDPDEAVRLTRAVAGAGADGVVAISPALPHDPRSYYARLAEHAGGTPVLAYHFPGVVAPGVPVDVLPDLPVAGLKDSGGDPDRLVRELALDGGPPLYVGNPLLLSLAGVCGAAGAIMALGNVAMGRCAAAFAGDLTAQREIVQNHLDTSDDVPRRLKQLLAERHGTSAATRTGLPAGAAAARAWGTPEPA